MEIMKGTPWSRIRGQNSVDKGLLEIVGNGKPTGSVLKETLAVSVTISISVQNRHSRILLRALLRGRMREMYREPEVREAKVPVEECLDCRAKITSKELAPLHSVKDGILQYACSTSPRVDADLGKSALICTARLKNSLAKGPKRIVTKVQWLGWRSMSSIIERGYAYSSNTRQLGCVFQDMEPPKLSSILRKSSDMQKPIQRVKCTTAIARHTKIWDPNPSLGMICPGEPHQRSSNAPKFEDRSQEETEWQEHGAREAAWTLAKSVLKIKGEKQSSILFIFGK